MNTPAVIAIGFTVLAVPLWLKAACARRAPKQDLMGGEIDPSGVIDPSALHQFEDPFDTDFTDDTEPRSAIAKMDRRLGWNKQVHPL